MQEKLHNNMEADGARSFSAIKDKSQNKRNYGDSYIHFGFTC